jgi:hypothetical protein
MTVPSWPCSACGAELGLSSDRAMTGTATAAAAISAAPANIDLFIW